MKKIIMAAFLATSLGAAQAHAFLPLLPIIAGGIAGADIATEGESTKKIGDKIEETTEDATTRIKEAWEILTK